MSNQGLFALVFLVALAVLVAWGVWRGIRMSRARRLKERFGPEYDRAREKYGKDAHSELQGRVTRVEQLPLKQLTGEQIERFEAAWRNALGRFIDDPALAVAEADRLAIDVLEARGYPLADMDRLTADISVDHPHVVHDYRMAHSIAGKSKSGLATTEEMRESMVHFRTVFQDLITSRDSEIREVQHV